MAPMAVMLVLLCALLGMACGELIMVQTVTRHGERAPDKIVTKQSCRAIWPNVKKLKKDFSALPGRLTPLGVDSMREVGRFVRSRYVDNGFVTDNYQQHPDEWDFIAREGYRQQRSMSAMALGIFPNQPVPVEVVPRLQDSSLGGPAPACGAMTAKMIVEWYNTKGREAMLREPELVHTFEKICDVNLTDNPVNAKPGGPNPHAWIGDISDSLDSAFAVGVDLPKSITRKLHEELTELAFSMEQGSHYDDPQGAIMFVGSFPGSILKDFEQWDGAEKRPKKMPLVRMQSCSRELLYGLQHLFGWQTEIKGEPKGRVSSGTTFIWELHRVADELDATKSSLVVKTFYWTPGMKEPERLQKDLALKAYREKLEAYKEKHGGSWEKICDYEHFNVHSNEHDSGFENPLVVMQKKRDADKTMLATDDDADDDDDVAADDDAADVDVKADEDKETEMLAAGPEAEAALGALSRAHGSALIIGGLALGAVGAAVAVRARLSQTGYQRI